MEVLDVLLATRELLGSPEKWTKGANARDSYGNSCNSASPEAVQFCLNGAMQRNILNGKFSSADLLNVTKTINLLVNEMWFGDIPIGPVFAPWNDFEERTHEDILHVLDKAIAVAMLDNLRKVDLIVERELERV